MLFIFHAKRKRGERGVQTGIRKIAPQKITPKIISPQKIALYENTPV